MPAQPRFLDSFDSVRKHRAQALTDGQIKLHLLLGETIRLSQTQAFDSQAILRYGAEAEFLELIRKGAIEIVMQPGFANPWDSFAGKVKDASFHLSAWPEFEEVGRENEETAKRAAHLFSRVDAGKLIDEATRRRKVPWDLPAELETRWNSLMEISRACEEARTWRPQPTAQQVTRLLGDRIQAAAERRTAQLHLLPHLKQLAAAGAADGGHRRNDRSLYHRHVQTDTSMDGGIRQSLHSIIDMLYNEVISESLESSAELTTHANDAKEIVEQQSASGKIQIGEGEGADLEGLSWPLLLKLRSILEDDELSSEKKRAFFRERCVLDPFRLEGERGWAFRIMPKVLDAGVDLAVGKVITFIVEGAMPGALTGPGGIIMSLATSVSASIFLRAGERLELADRQGRAHRQERNIVALLDRRLAEGEQAANDRRDAPTKTGRTPNA